MANWTLNDIINKVRTTTGRPDVNMMSDATVISYINNYYQFVLPKELKIFWGSTYYQFYAQPNIDQYPAPADFITFSPRVWADGFPIEWYIDPDLFYQDWPEKLNKSVVAQGDGTTTTFTFQLSAYPILPGSLYVSDGTATNTASDNGLGGFVAPCSGSIDYTSGEVSVTFPSAPNSNVNITQTSFTYLPNRPQAILFYKSAPLADATPAAIAADNMYVLRPVPDQTYLIKMEAEQLPPALTNLTDVPFRTDLGPLIAYGASLEIFADFDQMDQYQQFQVQYNRYKDVSMQDTYEEYLTQRSVPAF